jgi:hypothetical protein
LAAHLAGSSYELLEHKHAGFDVLAYASTWDSAESAAKFLEQYVRVLRGKWKQLDIESQTATRIEGRGDDTYFRVWIEGATVRHLEGLKSPVH